MCPLVHIGAILLRSRVSLRQGKVVLSARGFRVTSKPETVRGD